MLFSKKLSYMRSEIKVYGIWFCMISGKVAVPKKTKKQKSLFFNGLYNFRYNNLFQVQRNFSENEEQLYTPKDKLF